MPIHLDDLPTAGLRTFAEVVGAGSIEAAAAELGVTASAVSQRIKALEHRVGAVLLQRTRPVRPTPTGEVVHRLARQVELAAHDAARALDDLESVHGLARVTLVANSDALATWMLGTLADTAIEHDLLLEILREDESHTTEFLQRGVAMAAVSTRAEPVQGCTATPLGTWEYLPMAHPAFVRRWFGSGFTLDAARRAPVVQFDEKDTDTLDYAAWVLGETVTPPRHYVPDAIQYVAAIAHGLGWGMVEQSILDAYPAFSHLVPLPGSRPFHVDLHWHQWAVDSPTLDAVAAAVQDRARSVLSPRHG
ncbi:ArgP/LysG family DNA-binding transcriptional regulator [Brevibacterium litoralis]|uniref:ArgP/LysG family DNA-binding transcriptional regulator n=1 Tax=Brevibacterium litoralis TaxID=3138935 RepID=UPI0032EB7AAB